jgi:hypothetical protein
MPSLEVDLNILWADPKMPPRVYRYFDRAVYANDFTRGEVYISTLERCRTLENSNRLDAGEATESYASGCRYQKRRPCWNHCRWRLNLSRVLARWQSSDWSWRHFEIAVVRARSCSSRSSHSGISSRSLNDRTNVAFG